MSPVKSVLIGLAVGLIAYGAATGFGGVFVSHADTAGALLGTKMTPTLAPVAPGAKHVAPTLAPSLAPLAPTLAPSVTVTPRISSIPTRTPTPIATVTPRITTPTPTPTPTSTPTSTPSPTPTPTPIPVESPRVVINEIAWAGTKASQYGEWIELYNFGDVSVDLSGWAIYKTGDVKLIDLAQSIMPKSYFLIERYTDSSKDPISDIVADISGKFAGSGMRNTLGELLELRSLSSVVDSVDCSMGVWFAGSDASVKDISERYATMERISATVSGNDSANWASNNGLITTGVDASGDPVSGAIRGTPKFKNSVSL